ncbi:Uncharacterised protein [Vibrio cholerae]|nr:Uncharacterised protein [Vibrio cholerae]
MQQQIAAFFDVTTDVIWQAAVGKGNVGATLEHDDFSVFAESTRTSRRRGSTCNTTNNHYFRHELLQVSC